MALLRLFLIFVKIGAILLGGGFVILPIMQSEFCKKRNLLTQDELVEYFTLSQTLPGIIAANMSIFVGYKLKGILGAIVAMFGIIFVPFLSIVILASVLNIAIEYHCVQGALWGVGVAVIALIFLTFREMWQKSQRNNFFYLIFTISLIFLLICHLSPIQVIIISACFGVGVKRLCRRNQE